MAEFHQCVTTKQGLNLIALSRVNKCPLVFTKRAIGDSRPTDTSTISAMTALVDEKLTSDICQGRVQFDPFGRLKVTQ